MTGRTALTRRRYLDLCRLTHAACPRAHDSGRRGTPSERLPTSDPSRETPCLFTEPPTRHLFR